MMRHIILTWVTVSLLYFTQTAAIADELPNLGDSTSAIVSLKQEKALGRAWLRSLRANVETYNEPIVFEYFENLIYQLAPFSNVADRDFMPVILDSRALNAFAVPGSIIGVNAGLFLHAHNEQEFASVVAHELAHLGQRHYARRTENQRLTAPLALVGILASAVIAATTGSDAGLAALATTQAASIEQQLRFSRQNESEADRIGIQNMYRAGFDPRAMPSMFERMLRASRLAGNTIPEYLSTHPLSENRVSDTRNRADQLPPKPYRESLQFHLARSIVAAHYIQQQSEADAYYNDMIENGNALIREAGEFGLAYANVETDPERSIAILDRLLAQKTKKIAYWITYADALFSVGKASESIEVLNEQLALNPGNKPLQMMLLSVLERNQSLEEAQSLLTQLAKAYPEDPNLWYQLAELNGLTGRIIELHLARAEYFYLTGRFDSGLKQLRLALDKAKDEQSIAIIQDRTTRMIDAQKAKDTMTKA